MSRRCKVPESSLRLAIRTELDRLASLSDVLLRRTPLLKGSLYEQSVHCGKPSCRGCASGRLHRRWRLSRQENGRTKLYPVKPGERDALSKQIAEWRACREALRELSDSLDRLRAAGKALVGLREVIPVKSGKERRSVR